MSGDFVYLKKTVYEAALERISWLYDEFDEVVVSFSGGKDSTIILNLALQVAEEKGRLPVTVLFLDQEAEWQNVIDYVRSVMDDPRVNPMWVQCPIRLTNSTSHEQHYLNCWEEGGDWMRDKEPDALTENVYGTDRFHKIFPEIYKHHFPDKTLAVLTGMRAEESERRLLAIIMAATYKGETWGRAVDKDLGHYNFFPIYDWSYTDVWKAIHDHGWEYAKAYDYFYQYGVNPIEMRISNLHHETAIHQLFYLQEIERDTWDKLTQRLGGINQARHMTKADMFQCPKELPYMFGSWAEYRDHLLENLVTDEAYRDRLQKVFDKMDVKYSGMRDIHKMHRVHIVTILAQDIDLTKIKNWQENPNAVTFIRWKRNDPSRNDAQFVQKSKNRAFLPLGVA